MKNRDRGFTLVEILVAVGLVGGMAVAAGRYYQRHTKIMDYNSTRIAIFNKITAVEGLLDGLSGLQLAAEKAGNGALRDCLFYQTGNCLAAANSGDFRGFRLYDPADDRIRISGTTNDPVYYDAGGRICNKNREKCSFALTTAFQPHCFPGANQQNCNAAQAVLVRYRMYFLDKNNGLIPATPGGRGHYQPVEVIREIDVEFVNIWKRLNQTCPVGYGIRGINFAYQVRCENDNGDPGNPQVVLPPPPP